MLCRASVGSARGVYRFTEYFEQFDAFLLHAETTSTGLRNASAERKLSVKATAESPSIENARVGVPRGRERKVRGDVGMLDDIVRGRCRFGKSPIRTCWPLQPSISPVPSPCGSRRCLAISFRAADPLDSFLLYHYHLLRRIVSTVPHINSC